MSQNRHEPRRLYVGTYTAPHTAPGEPHPSEALGIHVFDRHEDGSLCLIETISAENPSYLAMSPDRATLYAVSELGEDASGAPLGRVLAFRRDPATGRLAALNSQPTDGTWPCHLSVTEDGRHLMAANYGSGSFAVFPLDAEGRIGAISDLKCCAGQGPDPARQKSPHAHFIREAGPSGLVFGADLGSDQVLLWRRDTSSGTLKPAVPPTIKAARGAGPRHLAIHPDTGDLYVLNELSSTIDVFSAPSDDGGALLRQSVPTLPPASNFARPAFDAANPGFIPEGGNTTAELRFHPGSRFL